MVAGLSVQRAALVDAQSRVQGVIDPRLLAAHTVQYGVLQPRLTWDAVLALFEAAPQEAARLAVRIVELTTGR